ncbi:MAG: sodium:proton antiporter, partial [Terrimicrobiaceae bacterium]|nr:sodium:proton antiporter [Terrimicrobiaceae bacterium]
MVFLATGGAAPDVPLWAAVPFGLLLLSIAAGPLAFPRLWHAHYPKIAAALGLVTASYYFFVLHAPERLVHAGHEYLSFMALIGSLFVVAGGIHITVQGESRPLANVVFLAIGAVLANFIGTTGAAMLLIRPWIRMNKFRVTGFHIVFFIFIVANAGGCLTPIGDPPLFLGYLRGVPFAWVFLNSWPAWLLVVGLLLAVFYALDLRNFRRPPRAVAEELTASERWNFQGLHNLAFLAVILAAVLGNRLLPPLAPEALMVAAALGSWHTTPREVHKANTFHFEPIRE